MTRSRPLFVPNPAVNHPRPPRALLITATLGTLVALSACAPSRSNNAPVEFRGSSPSTQQRAVPGAGAAGGIIAYDGYEAAVASDGDTVDSVARRIGLSGGELGAYNGLQPSTVLRAGDELVLPPRPGGYGGARVGSSSAVPQVPDGTSSPAPFATTPGATTPGATTPGATAGRGVLSDGTPITAEALPGAGAGGATGAAATNNGGFSLDAIAAAIEEPAAEPSTAVPASDPQVSFGGTALAAAPVATTGAEQATTAGPGQGTLTPPPSSSQPLPPEPTTPRTPASPELGRTQTGGPEIRPAPETVATERAAEAADAEAAAEVALAERATGGGAAEDLGISFRRPVSGEILIPYNVSPGGTRNEGVDFAATPGSPIIASAAGEVALVSQSLGGLGTIVLIRHRNDILTVYGRVDNVTVNKGSRVAAGEQIGVVAPGDGAGPPKMHFEIRRGAESVNPELYL